MLQIRIDQDRAPAGLQHSTDLAQGRRRLGIMMEGIGAQERRERAGAEGKRIGVRAGGAAARRLAQHRKRCVGAHRAGKKVQNTASSAAQIEHALAGRRREPPQRLVLLRTQQPREERRALVELRPAVEEAAVRITHRAHCT